MLIDSHCHLNYPGLVDDQQGALARARAAGVTGFLNISTRQREWAEIVALAERETDVWASVGIHPHEADGHADLGAEALLTAAEHPQHGPGWHRGAQGWWAHASGGSVICRAASVWRWRNACLSGS